MIWAVPSTRDRVLRIDPTDARQRRLARGGARARLAGALPRRAGAARLPLEVVDRDGTAIRGAPAVALALSRLPLTAWFALPALLLPGRPPGAAGAGDDRGRLARPRARLAGRPDPGAARSSSRSASWRRRSAARRSRAAELRRSAQAAVDWFVRNQRAGRHAGSTSTTPTTTRRRPSTTSSATPGRRWASTRPRRPGCRERCAPPTAGTEWALDRLLERDGWAAVAFDGRDAPRARPRSSSPGSTIRREATGDTRYDDVLRRLGRFLVAQTEPSGAVLASYDPARGAPVPGEYSKYYTGEAYWALARLHRDVPGRGLGRGRGPHRRLPGDRARRGRGPLAADPRPLGRLRAGRDRGVPRARPPPLTDAELAYARRQAELFGGQARWVSQRFGPWGARRAGQPTCPAAAATA